MHPPSLELSERALTCHLDSPWVKLRAIYSQDPILHASFIWNERQVLLDQVLLAGTNPGHMQALSPIEPRVFESYVEKYATSVLLAASREARATAQLRISQEVPADIAWLFRHSWQSTKTPFSMIARHELGLTLKRATALYAALSEKLLDRCLIPEKRQEVYKTVLQLDPIINLGEYRIDSSH